MMMLDSIKNAEEDMKVKALLEATNEGNAIILASNKFMEQNRDVLSTDDIDKIKEFSHKLEEQIKMQDKDGINSVIDQINTFTSPLAQKAMERAISESIRGKKI